VAKGCSGGSVRAESASISRTCSGNCDASNGRNAREVAGSVPGARPIPRSIRLGWSASSVERLGHAQRRMVRQHDAVEPTRIRLVAEATLDQDFRHRTGDAGHAVMLGEPVAREAQPLAHAPARPTPESRRWWTYRRALAQIENRQRNHPA
jgi:hypothetical protein